MGRPTQRISFYQATDDGEQTPSTDVAGSVARLDVRPAPGAAPTTPFRLVLHTIGVPVVEDADTAKAAAIGLLQLGAEVEHALMVQYLYAAGSVSGSDPKTGEDYWKKLMNIAIQEMAHLATVQNLLLLLGGKDALHLQRDALRKDSPKNPIPFVLEPVSKRSLAKYVSVEKPLNVPAELKDRVDALEELAKEDLHVAPHRVGMLYAALRWLFLPAQEADAWMSLDKLKPVAKYLTAHLTDADLRPRAEVESYETSGMEWMGGLREDMLFETPHTCAEAVGAIDRISKQGEGLEDTHDSHFYEFIELLDALEQGNLKVTPMARSPHLGSGNGGEDGEAITNPYTLLWGKVFSLQYGLMVLSIHHALGTPRSDAGHAALREDLLGVAVKCMKKIIKPLSALFSSLTLRPNGAGGPAGPPFDLDPALVDPGTEKELADRHIEQLHLLEKIYGDIEKATDFAQFPDHENLLKNLRSFDAKHLALFPAAPASPQ